MLCLQLMYYCCNVCIQLGSYNDCGSQVHVWHLLINIPGSQLIVPEADQLECLSISSGLLFTNIPRAATHYITTTTHNYYSVKT